MPAVAGLRRQFWIFRRKIVWERKKYQDYTVCRANWRSFPLLMLSHCNKLSIKTLKHTIFSMKIPHWHQILVIFMIYALLSRNFDVRIYALFPQIFGNWKVDSADFFTFRMYGGWDKTLLAQAPSHFHLNLIAPRCISRMVTSPWRHLGNIYW